MHSSAHHPCGWVSVGMTAGSFLARCTVTGGAGRAATGDAVKTRVARVVEPIPRVPWGRQSHVDLADDRLVLSAVYLVTGSAKAPTARSLLRPAGYEGHVAAAVGSPVAECDGAGGDRRSAPPRTTRAQQLKSRPGNAALEDMLPIPHALAATPNNPTTGSPSA